jgi:hypothetical protein
MAADERRPEREVRSAQATRKEEGTQETEPQKGGELKEQEIAERTENSLLASCRFNKPHKPLQKPTNEFEPAVVRVPRSRCNWKTVRAGWLVAIPLWRSMVNAALRRLCSLNDFAISVPHRLAEIRGSM